VKPRFHSNRLLNIAIADAALYGTLKPSVDNAGVLQVFANLQAASLNSHLPAFDACN
jgi:hypothetical protein